MKRVIKRLANGFFNLIDTPAVVLLYHRVVDLSLDPQELCVSPENFDAHLGLLHRKYNVLSVEEFTELVNKGKGFPSNAVLLTFDDGYADNHFNARPILEDHQMQALFFVATGLIDTSLEFWWDDIERIFLLDNNLPEKLSISVKGTTYEFPTDQKSKARTYNELHPVIKRCDVAERADALLQILQWSGLPAEGRTSHRVMTWSELVDFSKSPAVVVGAHTHTHPRLSNCNLESQRSEIGTSMKLLQGALGKDIVHFSYPFGNRPDYNENSIQVCRELGFQMVCANYPSTVHRWHSKYAVPRMLVRNWEVEEFDLRMKTFFNS